MREDQKTAARIHPDFYYGLVLMIIGGGLLWHTTSDRYVFDSLFDDVSTVFFPRIVLILWIGLSATLIVNGLRGRGSEEDRARLMAVGIPRLFLVLAVIVASAVILWAMGLLVGGGISMIAVGLALGYRRLVILVPVSISLPIITWYALGKIAKISLPSGVLWD
jgi:small-conductance mechanosensitive channel